GDCLEFGTLNGRGLSYRDRRLATLRNGLNFGEHTASSISYEKTASAHCRAALQTPRSCWYIATTCASAPGRPCTATPCRLVASRLVRAWLARPRFPGNRRLP